jgi:hypothetical protein
VQLLRNLDVNSLIARNMPLFLLKT